MRKEKTRNIDIRYFLVPFIIMSLVFFYITFYIVSVRTNETYKNFNKEAINLSRTYSDTIINSHQAYNTVLEYMKEKLILASEAVMLAENNTDINKLSELAIKFNLDEIHLYDSDGRIIYSKGNKYLGWKAFKGHPVYNFMVSNQRILVEDIRTDTESGVFYKYAYIKNDDGSFIQIGILADKIQGILDNFEFQSLINQFSNNKEIYSMSYINNDFEIIASSKSNLIGSKIQDDNIRIKLKSNNEYSFRTSINSTDVFQIYVPINQNNERYGYLAISWLTQSSDAIIQRIIISSLIIFLILILVNGSILYYAYLKNKSNIKVAYYDEITKLPNKAYLEDYLEKMISDIGINKAIFLINFSNFKHIKMIYGSEISNKILNQILNKIQDIISNQDMLFRYSSDIFILTKKNYITLEDLKITGNKISEIFKYPFLNDYDYEYILSKIIVYEISNNNVSSDRILQDLFLSLNYAKGTKSNSMILYEEEVKSIARRTSRVEKILREVINGENESRFYLEFQPKLDINTDKIVGFEALARLNTDEFGQISPVEFIEIAEVNYIIYDLGKLILIKACEFVKQLESIGYTEVTVAVNISGIQLLRDEFTEDILKIIELSNINIEHLEFEITESVLLDNFDMINEKLKSLKKLGVKISLDDFGTGYSSLARLRELNIDVVKLDRYFIRKIKNDSDENLFSADIISMTHKIGLEIVAEGVEEEVQKRYLQKHGCDIIQGYLISKPLKNEKAIRFLEDYASDGRGFSDISS